MAKLTMLPHQRAAAPSFAMREARASDLGLNPADRRNTPSPARLDDAAANSATGRANNLYRYARIRTNSCKTEPLKFYRSAAGSEHSAEKVTKG
jgi:hypothetical protein